MKTIINFTFVLLSISLFAQINVPADFQTIQQAIDNATANETIIVQNGTYTENLIIDKPIVIKSVFSQTQNPDDITNTIIDGNQLGSTIKAENINGTIFIEGFTIRNGSGSLYEIAAFTLLEAGGGFYINEVQNLILENLIIKDNQLLSANNFGGGIFAKNSNLQIGSCIFDNNYTNGDNFFGDGSAMKLINCETSIVFSEFKNNLADGYDSDAAIKIDEGSFSIYRTKIFDNTQGIYSNESNISIINSEFYNTTMPLYANGGYGSINTSINNITHNLTIFGTNFHDNIEGFRSNGTTKIIEMEATIQDSFFNNNDNFYGSNSGAINTLSSILNITNTEIKNNTASYLTPTGFWYHGEGAGLRLAHSQVTMNSCNISNNSCNSEEPIDIGGAFYLSHSDLSLDNCIIANNIANEGGAIASFGECNVKIYKSVFYGNNAKKGSVLISVSSDIQIINSTITKNFNEENNATAFYTYGGDDILFLNSIIWNEGMKEIIKYNDNSGATNLTFSHSNIRGMETNFTAHGTLNKTWLDGNLDSNSLFLDNANNDFNLADNSPLINFGIPFFELNNEIILNLSNDDYIGVAPEIGAFEKQNVLVITNDSEVSKNLQIVTNNGVIYIKTLDNKLIKSLLIYDIQGRKLIDLKPNKNDLTIQTNVNQGTILFMKAVIENNQTINKKFMNR